MKEIDNERRTWLDFIARMNDRLISRRRSSGVTLWAIVIAVAYLVYSIIDRISILSNDYALLKLLPVTFITVSNVFYALICLLGAYIIRISSATRDIRLISPIRRLQFQNIIGIAYFLSACFVALNIFIALNVYHFDIVLWPYFVFAAYIFIQLIAALFKYILARWQLKKYYSDAPHIFDTESLLSEASIKRFMIIFSAVAGLALLSVAFYSAIILFQSLSLYDYPNIIKLSLELYALILLIVLSLGLLAGMQQHQYLEELERKIVIDNMQVKDIRYAFIKEYLGETTGDFINKTESKLGEYYDKCIKVIHDGQQELDTIRDIDQQYSYEIDKRRSDICKKIKEVQKVYISYSEKSIAHISYLVDRNAFSENREVLKHLFNIWRSNNDNVVSAGESLCEKCRNIHPQIGLDKC